MFFKMFFKKPFYQLVSFCIQKPGIQQSCMLGKNKVFSNLTALGYFTLICFFNNALLQNFLINHLLVANSQSLCANKIIMI